MLKTWKMPIIAILGGLLGLAVGWGNLEAQNNDYQPILRNCPPCLSVVNAFVRADVDPAGRWVEGTTGGDPDTALDDDKRLLYGFNATGGSLIGTGFTTIRVSATGFLTNFVPSTAVSQHAVSDLGMCPPDCTATCPPECNEVVTGWEVDYPSGTVRITETLEAAQNPFSGRPDVILASYEVHNLGSGNPEVGLRALLDVRIHENDGAPYIIPGVGALTRERHFQGDEVPSFWLAFESPQFEPDQLRAVGILDSPDIDPPDEFIVGRWGRMQFNRWEYTVDPAALVTSDSAVALYWLPETLAPNERRTYQTEYGVAGNRGGGAFISSPVGAGCEAFTVAIFVSNFDATPLTGGSSTLVLPTGLELMPGESASKPLPDIDPADTASVTWEVRAVPGTNGTLPLQVNSTFDGNKQISASADIDVICAATPTPTATATETATSTPPPSPTNTNTPDLPTETPTQTATTAPTSTSTRTPTDSPTATPSMAPTQGPSMGVCDFLSNRVPTADINLVLANPTYARGWDTLCFPNRPPGPFNYKKQWLSLRNIAVPYHRHWNPLIWKCGCP